MRRPGVRIPSRPPFFKNDLERAKQSYRGMLGLSSLPDSFRYLVIHPERHCLSAAASVNTSRLIAFKRAAHRGAAFHAQVHGRASRIRKNKEDRKQRKPLDSEPGSKAQHGVKPSSTLAGFSAQRWSRKGPD